MNLVFVTTSCAPKREIKRELKRRPEKRRDFGVKAQIIHKQRYLLLNYNETSQHQTPDPPVHQNHESSNDSSQTQKTPPDLTEKIPSFHHHRYQFSTQQHQSHTTKQASNFIIFAPNQTIKPYTTNFSYRLCYTNHHHTY